MEKEEKKKKGFFSVRDITEISMLIALSIILDRFVRIPAGSTGGSINISMVPIFIIALRHGFIKSFISGAIIYGLITCLLDNYGFACYPLEYFVAFGSTSILGLFGRFINKNCHSDNSKGFATSLAIIIFSIALWSVIRFFAASIDSVILYKYSFAAAFSYNAVYVFPSALIDLVLVILLLPVVLRLNSSFKTSYLQD